MGERLNLEILYDGTVAANAYYHWSGFTSSALELTGKALEMIPEEELGYASSIGVAVKALEYTGALLTKSEYKAYTTITPTNCLRIPIASHTAEEGTADRNSGLISVTTYGVLETREWEEERVSIDLKTRLVKFGAIHNIEESDIEEVIQEYGEIKNVGNWKDLIIPAKEFRDFKEKVLALVKDEIYAFSCGGKNYLMIE